MTDDVSIALELIYNTIYSEKGAGWMKKIDNESIPYNLMQLKWFENKA